MKKSITEFETNSIINLLSKNSTKAEIGEYFEIIKSISTKDKSSK